MISAVKDFQARRVPREKLLSFCDEALPDTIRLFEASGSPSSPTKPVGGELRSQKAPTLAPICRPPQAKSLGTRVCLLTY